MHTGTSVPRRIFISPDGSGRSQKVGNRSLYVTYFQFLAKIILLLIRWEPLEVLKGVQSDIRTNARIDVDLASILTSCHLGLRRSGPERRQQLPGRRRRRIKLCKKNKGDRGTSPCHGIAVTVLGPPPTAAMLTMDVEAMRTTAM